MCQTLSMLKLQKQSCCVCRASYITSAGIWIRTMKTSFGKWSLLPNHIHCISNKVQKPPKSHPIPLHSTCPAAALILAWFLEMLNFSFPPSPPCPCWLFSLSHMGMWVLVSSADGAGTAFPGGNMWCWVGGRGTNDLCVVPFFQTHVSVPPKSWEQLKIVRF